MNINVSDIKDNGHHLRSSTYENEVKETPIVSTPPEDSTVDKMEILMSGFIKYRDKCVEWRRVIRK